MAKTEEKRPGREGRWVICGWVGDRCEATRRDEMGERAMEGAERERRGSVEWSVGKRRRQGGGPVRVLKSVENTLGGVRDSTRRKQAGSAINVSDEAQRTGA